MLLAAEREKLDQLVTLDGTTYTTVTIREVAPDGISILHETGATKIPFEKLPADLQAKYCYDKAAAAEYRKQEAKAQRQQDAAERDAIAKRKQAAEAQVATDADKEFAGRVQKAAKMVRVEAIQNSRLGLVGGIKEGTLTTTPVKSSLGSTVGEKPAWVYKTAAKGGVIAATTGAKVGIERDESGVPYGLPATEKMTISWEGKAWRIGLIQYANAQGIEVTKPYYTASEKEAAAFYKRNGFSPKSDNIAQEAE
ncbi:hypothetical protein WKV53_16075 [Luteolibacter sp. Y139]|uniref:Uncharacterized protein n=1 Tax=Luteolibacter soli TaxID=3135280 RepID=A0ABU9AWA7_9BACT